MTRSKLSILASPLLCLALLGGIVAEDRTHLKPADVEPYHAGAKAVHRSLARNRSRTAIGRPSDDRSLPPAAEQLLHPNCKIDRRYTSSSLSSTGNPAQASLLIVQCKDSRDMPGHYPPICYPGAGRAAGIASRFHFDRPAVPRSTEWNTISCKRPFPFTANACMTSLSCPARDSSRT